MHVLKVLKITIVVVEYVGDDLISFKSYIQMHDPIRYIIISKL